MDRNECITKMKSNQRTIIVLDKNNNQIGFEVIDIMRDRHDIIRLLNQKYPWKWEYYE